MSEKASILFVDDERQILISLRALFRSQYQVFIADDGNAALDIVRREPIHAVISDQRMPNMLGHELLREVKKISPSTMRLLLTGYSDLSAIMHSINDGEVFRFINKPWDNHEIRNIVDNAVNIAIMTQDTAAAVAHDSDDVAPGKKHDGAILVLDHASDTVVQVNALFQHQRTIHSARTIDQALDILDKEEVAVLITDVTLQGEDTTDFIKLLKQQYPLIMTIVLTQAIDAQAAVELINQGRIYRYLRKPVPDPLLRPSIEHGLRFYQANKNNPVLLEQQKVEPIAVLRNPSLSERLRDRFKAFRKRFWFGWSKA